MYNNYNSPFIHVSLLVISILISAVFTILLTPIKKSDPHYESPLLTYSLSYVGIFLFSVLIFILGGLIQKKYNDLENEKN